MKLSISFYILLLLVTFHVSGVVYAQSDEYRKTLEMADNYFAGGDYINAKASYQIAVRLAPDDPYPKEMLQQTLALIRQQMSQSALYTEKIVVADELFNQKDYESALKIYQEALSYLPGDTYATGRISEIGKTLQEAREREENYAKSIAAADQFLKAGQLDEALAAYQKAAGYKPSEEYPKAQAANIEKQLAEQQALAGDYETALQAADEAMRRNKFDEAIRQLEQAASLRPEEKLPLQKLEEARQKKSDYEAYAAIIEEGDNLYINKDFALAREKYQQAAALNAQDDYPRNMLEKIDIALMDITKANQSSYEVAIALADKYYDEQDYERAMAEYRNALRFKPDEAYARKKIDNINQTLAVIKSQQEAYAQAIAKADNLFQAKSYREAKDEYQRAIGINAFEQYPRVKIDEINVILAELENQREIYNSLIKGADKLFFADNYVEALEQYHKASDMFPKEQYPIDQITMIYEILGIRDRYTKSVTNADKLLMEKRYEEALAEYRNAAAIDGKELYPQGKIYEIERMLAEQEQQASLRREYDSVLVLANARFAAGEYDLAMELFRSAEVILPGESYPGRKMEEIRQIYAERENQAKLEEQFRTFVDQGDRLLAANDLQGAAEAYQSALKLKPGEQYPMGKISQINEALGELAAREALEQQYRENIAKGDALMTSQNYSAALEAYNTALGLKPGEQYPMGKIAQINEALGEIAAKEALEKKYSDVITQADQLMAAQDYTSALEAYQSALSLKPGEAYATDKIAEATAALGEIAAREALEKQYRDIISQADQLFSAQDYTAALETYQSALKLKPGEEYPAKQIAQVNAALGEIAAKEALEKQYRDIIAQADQLFSAQNYTAALDTYQSALKLKPGEAYPTGKIAEANAALGEIAAKEALEEQYRDAITQADQLLAAQNYTAALETYQSALKLKPGETYPAEKIAVVNAALGEIAAKEAFEKQYRDVISRGDQLLAAQDYTAALETYQSALSLKPGEAYPTEKIAQVNAALGEIAAKEALEKQYGDVISRADQFLAAQDYTAALETYQSALKLKPGEAYPAEKIAKVNAALDEIAAKEALEKQYRDIIAQADKLLSAQDYTAALETYQSALSLKPGEVYPAEKIAQVNAALDEIAAKEALEKRYRDIIAQADQLLAAQDYTAALETYQSALKLKPGEKYPADKINEANEGIAELARIEEINKKYNDAVAFGDRHFTAGDYENARYEYQVANSIKPSEEYPLKKIAEVDALTEEIRKQKEIDNRYQKAVASGDEFFSNDKLEEARSAYQEARNIKPGESYPDVQLSAINSRLEVLASQREEAYQAAISKADAYLQQGDNEMAKIQYDRAVELKPSEVYPLDKLKLVNEQIMKKRQIIQEEYDKAIADADKFYASKIYDNAIDAFRNATLLKPDEEYPKEMVRRILKMISDRSIVQMNKDPLLIPNNTQHKFDFLPVSVKDRRSNYIFFRARNVSENEYKLIINFGQDQAKNGGVVIKVPPGTEMNEYIVRISAQYKWFSDDNNWITFYPEGGDFEVSLLQISYSD